MASSDRNLDVVAFVTDHFRDIVRRRLSELAGLALITCALLGVIALATWSVQDPSLSHATQTPIKNLLGFPGAIFSDLAMQLLGLASVLLLLPEALLGWRLLAHRPLGEKWRGLVWIAATFLAAAFASMLPRSGSWPLPTGLGGACGDGILTLPTILFGAPLDGMTLIALSAGFGLAAVLTLAIASGLRWPSHAQKPPAQAHEEVDDEIDDDAEADHGSPWLGMVVHALLSWKARLGRMLRGAVRKPLPAGAVAPAGARQEPRFDNLGRVAAPSMAPAPEAFDPEEEYEDEEAEPAPRRRAAAPKPRKSGSGFVLPSLNLLTAQKVSERTTLPKDVLDANSTALESVLSDFGVRGEIINARPGPVLSLIHI